MKIRLVLLLAVALLNAAAAHARADDPLGSARWQNMREAFFGKQDRVEFDERVKVVAPSPAEDPMNVPVSVRTDGLADVERIVVFADFNPILKVLDFQPGRALPSLAFRMKLQQSSPVRAAVRTRDGVWHVGGTWVDTAGGGCTAPSAGRGTPQWQLRLGEVQGRIWPRTGSPDRVRVRIMHPMDTGLAAGIPAFHIEELKLAEENGSDYLRLQVFEPVSENPVFTFDVDPTVRSGRALLLTGVDNNGNRIAARIAE